MSTPLSPVVTWLAALLTSTALLTGCGNSCEDLAEVCGDCADASYEESCDQTVHDNVQDVCGAVLADYKANCVGEQGGGSTTSSSGTGGSTSSSGTGGSTSSGTGGSTSSSGTGGSTGGAGGGAGGAGGAGGSAGGAGGAGGA